MNYKSILKTTLAGFLLLGTASCDSYLDITPEGQVKLDEQLSYAEGIEDALYGAYAEMRADALYGRSLSFYTLDIMAQYFNCYGNNTVTALKEYDYKYSGVEASFQSTWTKMYNAISSVNAIIRKAKPLQGDQLAFPYNIYKGEALALRAFMHFDLLRIFAEQYTVNPKAQGIPYQMDFSLNYPEFSSEEKCYQLILADLQEAERLLADEDEHDDSRTTFMTERRIHLNLHAVRATMARVYLTMGNKEKAEAYARLVIEKSGCELNKKTDINGDLAGVLSNKETLFGLYKKDFYTTVNSYLQQRQSFASLDPREDIMRFYDNENYGIDFRSTAYFTATDNDNASVKYRFSKLTDVYELNNNADKRPATLTTGINLIRLPEMYYIMAECLLDKNYDEALKYFDAVLESRGLELLENRPEPYNVLTQDVINEDRFKEFMGEGQTFFNCKRQNIGFTYANSETMVEPSNAVFVVPVPEIEFDNRK